MLIYEQCRTRSNEKDIKLTKLQNFKYEQRDFTHWGRLRNSNNFHLNVTEWLTSSGGTNCLKPIDEMSKEELNVFSTDVLHVCEKERWHTVSWQKFFKKIHLIAAIVCFLRSTNRFPRIRKLQYGLSGRGY